VTVPTLSDTLRWERIGLLKVDIEGYEKDLFGGNREWLRLVDAMCLECHEGFGQHDLERISEDYGFGRPRRLPGISLLERL